jgi:integrase
MGPYGNSAPQTAQKFHCRTPKLIAVSLYKGANATAQQQNSYNRMLNTYNSPALKEWQNELATSAIGTREGYLRYFLTFCKFANKTPDQLLNQRLTEEASQDKKTQRTTESLFRQFLAQQIELGYKPVTRQTIFASIRSFYEIHDTPLIMRRKDYPKGEANGVRRATKELTIKALEHANQNKTILTTIITLINDTGLGVSDLNLLKCNIILDNPNASIIPLTMLRKKTKTVIKTFLGEESITAIKKYLQARQNGTRTIKPETITKDSPLLRTQRTGTPQPMSRTLISNHVQKAYLSIGEKHISAHSLRKALQTNLEKGGMPTNWIDQILGHKLINSRDAYSLPTDEELQQAYQKAYDTIRIYPTKAIKPTTPTQQTLTQELADVQEARNMEEIKALLAKGYKYQMETNGIKLFLKEQT